MKTSIIFTLISFIFNIHQSISQYNDLNGKWTGEWTNDAGYKYNCKLFLNGDTWNYLAGSISWTLIKSPKSSDNEKLNRSAVEYITGKYEPTKNKIFLSGFDESDYFGIIGLDEYEMSLSNDKMQLEGKTKNGGNWKGVIKTTKSSETELINNNGTIQGVIEIYKTGADIYANTYTYLRPSDLSTYTYLSYYPLTAYLFCIYTDENKIDNLSIKDLKDLHFTQSNSSVFSLFYIKGFEDYAKELSNMDEFDIQSKKDTYIAKLKECYRNYINEFENRYLITEMVVYAGTKYYELKDRLKAYGKESSVSIIYPQTFDLDKEHYNFDRQSFQTEMPFFGYNYGATWDFNNEKKQKYHTYRGDEILNLSIPISDFKTILEKQNFGMYEMKVKPSRNIKSTLYGGMYYISLIDYLSMNILIVDSYKYLENYLYAPTELYRINVF